MRRKHTILLFIAIVCRFITYADISPITYVSPDFERDGLFYHIITDTEKIYPIDCPAVIVTREKNSAGEYIDYAGEITIPETVEHDDNIYSVVQIADLAFTGSDVTHVSLPNNLIYIGISAFSGSRIKEIRIPGNASYISEFAFSNSELETIEFENNSNTFSLGQRLFANCPIKEIRLPETTTGQIHFNLRPFYQCDKLERVIFPKGITDIYFISEAFFECTSLKEFICENPVPPVIHDDFEFNNIDTSNFVLKVPSGSGNAYKNADVWSKFINIEEVEKTPAGIDDIYIDNDNNITVNGCSVSIKAKGSHPLEVYSMTGALVHRTEINGNIEVPLEKGLYIVRIGSQAAKISIR